jgi:hypothetical protein
MTYAFPHNTVVVDKEGGVIEHHKGMTLRDFFAAKAMQGMYAKGSFPTGIMLDTAKEAYEMADAMLQAREA